MSNLGQLRARGRTRLGCFSTALLKKLPPFENGVCYGVMWELRGAGRKKDTRERWILNAFETQELETLGSNGFLLRTVKASYSRKSGGK